MVMGRMTRLIFLMLARHKRVCVSPMRVFDFRSVPSMGRKFYHWRNWVLVSIILPIATLRRQSMQNKHSHISESTDNCSAKETTCGSQAEVKLWGKKVWKACGVKAQSHCSPVLSSGLPPGRTIQILWHSIWLREPVGNIQADLQGGKVAYVLVSPLSSNCSVFLYVPKYAWVFVLDHYCQPA